MGKPRQIATTIVNGFNRHYKLYSKITVAARERFEAADWNAVQQASADRISYYDLRVQEAVEHLKSKVLDSLEFDQTLWQQVKATYIDYISFHPQAELAETFYNSVFCQLFHRDYFHNENIFVETTLADKIPVPKESVYRSYFPGVYGLRRTVKKIIDQLGFQMKFESLNRDIRYMVRAFIEDATFADLELHQMRFDILKSPFYRNKAAYVVGRVTSRKGSRPFLIPILNNNKGGLYIDSLITNVDQIAVTFGYARAYFMVDTEAPSALVHFLKEILPHRTLAELYNTIGFHKQGKTEFYRELLVHLNTTSDKFIRAPGIKGMVMEVFTLPSFPYVFKVIKDKFAPSKNFDRKTVKSRYQLVKQHDRVGRMADTAEYSHVGFPRDRFTDEFLEELKQTINSSMDIEDDLVIIKHLYIERRMIPLNIYLDTANDEEIRAAIYDYGQALKEMIAANIFPGDMLLKNFGLTRQKRVVFYDYDEVQYLMDMNFRDIPPARFPEQEMASEPWYSIGPDDVFPEELDTFMTNRGGVRKYFRLMHPELLTAKYWKQKQDDIREGRYESVFPYPTSQRFKYRFGQKDQAQKNTAKDVA